MTREIKHVAVVGTGLVGSAWAAFFASQGLRVTMYNSPYDALQQGFDKATRQLAFLREHGRVKSGLPDIGQPFTLANTLAEAVADADLVQESVTERYDVKIPLFRELDQLTRPDCILASSSSGLLMSRIQEELRHPERALIAHPFNPVHLVPLVELVGGSRTNAQLLEQMRQFFTGLGKVAVVLKREVAGYIGNRLQAAIWREAIQLVLDGVGTVEDIDRALAAGPGIRWALMGQHLIFHLGGGAGGIEYFVDHIGQAKSRLWEDMASWTSIPADAKAALAGGIREELRGRSLEQLEHWRDEQLAALLKLLESGTP